MRACSPRLPRCRSRRPTGSRSSTGSGPATRSAFPPTHDPSSLGLAFEALDIPTRDGLRLPAWWIPAGPDPAPGVVLIHGWESARDRTLPHAQILHAIGLHVLTIDVRGHGANGPEVLPMSVGEYAADARAAVAALRDRPEVTTIGILGHSMGAAGSLVAAASDPEVDAVIALAAPADPARLTRQTFRLARLPIPGVVAWPLAWLTTRVYLQPRGHTIASVSASHAVRAIRVPVLLDPRHGRRRRAGRGPRAGWPRRAAPPAPTR